MAKLRRSGFEKNIRKVFDAKLPLSDDSYTMLSAPVVDVSTASTYRKRNGADKGIDAHSMSVRTVQDFVKGTLKSDLQFDNTDKLKFARVNYKRESAEADLLGPMKARKFELGDVSGVVLPDGAFSGQEIGARVTNVSPIRSFSTPSTGISGVAIPGWGVEFYRNTQLLAVQEVGEDGFYQFSGIDLYLTDNNFRLVFYGPQGEIREEDVYVPVDRGLLSQNDGVYDVSVSLKGRNAYRKKKSDDVDDDSIRVSALYEKPLSDSVTGVFGVRSEENQGVRDSVANIGVSTTLGQALLNTTLAVDDEGEFSTDVVLRRNFGEHEARASFDYTMGGFDAANGGTLSAASIAQNNNVSDAYSSNLQLNGPVWKGSRSRLDYLATNRYSWTDQGSHNLAASTGLSLGLPYMNVNGLLSYNSGSSLVDDRMDFNANVAGRISGNRLRLSANYDVLPEAELNNVTASLNRAITQDLDFDFSATHRPLASLTEYQARLDWQAGFVRISPSVRYNSESDFFAGLNTRFGVLEDPSSNKLRFYDQNITNLGLASAFVYLDKDGDGLFNGEDEPLPEVLVSAPQSGKRVRTDENGVALFHRLQVLKLTDVYVDKDTLQDPTWIPGFEGVSLYPREGYVAQVDFPVHISGEVDGTLYVRAVSIDGRDSALPVALRNVSIKIYDDQGVVEAETKTDTTGFYYLTQIPPGRYLLVIDSKDAQNSNFIRPEPQAIEIGYDGTVIYGNDIYVNAGAGDIPSEILSDMEDYKGNHPHIDFGQDYNLVLNLGEYNSRLLMSVIWYKLRSRFSQMLVGGDLFVPPTESFADADTGKHSLRVGLRGEDISDAYARCKALAAREQYCKVEIYPAFMKHAQADVVAE